MTEKLETIALTPKQAKARRARSLALALLLAAFVIGVYAVTYFKIGADIATRTF